MEWVLPWVWLFDTLRCGGSHQRYIDLNLYLREEEINIFLFSIDSPIKNCQYRLYNFKRVNLCEL